MKRFIPLFEEFDQEFPMHIKDETNEELPIEDSEDGFSSEGFDDEEPQQTNHTQYLNSLGHMDASQIRQEFLEGNINTGTRKKVAAQVLGDLVSKGNADRETVELFHTLSDSMLSQ